MFLYHILKPLAGLAYSVFYQKIWILNKSQIPQNEAVILVANHSNTFIDPTIIASFQSRDLHFWARANEFKKPFLGWIARNVHILPVFRVQDGRENMSKNNLTFELSRDLLSRKGLLFIAPEGNCELERRLRTFKAGAAKLAYSFLKENPARKLYFLPTGLNYSDLIHSGGEAYVSFGQPLLANDFFGDNEAEFINTVMDKIYTAIKSQMLHIDTAENDKNMPKIWEMMRNDRDYLPDFQSITPKLAFEKMQSVFIQIQQLADYEQTIFTQKLNDYFDILAKNKLQDVAVVAADNISIFNFLATGLIHLLIFSNYIIHFLPSFLIKKLLKKSVKDLAFRSSVGLVAGLFITGIYYILMIAILAFFIGFYALLIPFILYFLYFVAFRVSKVKNMLQNVVKYKRWRIKNELENKNLLALRIEISSFWQK